MTTAEWNGKVIAQADKVEDFDGNSYFPMSALKKEYFEESSYTSGCPWKGTANYYTIKVDGKENKDAAWYYPTPKDAASVIKDHVAFWKGVTIKK